MQYPHAAKKRQGKQDSCQQKAAAEQTDAAPAQAHRIFHTECAQAQQHCHEQLAKNGEKEGQGRQENHQRREASECRNGKTSAKPQPAVRQPCRHAQQYVIDIKIEHEQHIEIDRLHTATAFPSVHFHYTPFVLRIMSDAGGEPPQVICFL